MQKPLFFTHVGRLNLRSFPGGFEGTDYVHAVGADQYRGFHHHPDVGGSYRSGMYRLDGGNHGFLLSLRVNLATQTARG